MIGLDVSSFDDVESHRGEDVAHLIDDDPAWVHLAWGMGSAWEGEVDTLTLKLLIKGGFLDGFFLLIEGVFDTCSRVVDGFAKGASLLGWYLFHLTHKRGKLALFGKIGVSEIGKTFKVFDVIKVR